MPNPNGCYVVLFERPDFKGLNDLLNGPRKWRSLDIIPEANHSRWTNRLRSLRLGPTAVVTVFTQPDFRGQGREYRAGTDHVSLPPEVSAKIQSLTIACEMPATSD